MDTPSEASAEHSATTSGYVPKNPKAHERYWSRGLRESKRALYQQRKQDFVARLGGKCVLCGFSGHLAALEFDHINPSEKRHNAGQVMLWKDAGQAWEEIQKCRLLCSNCHAIETYEKRQNVPQQRNRAFGPSWSGVCVRCGITYESVGPSRFCSSRCRCAHGQKERSVAYRSGTKAHVLVESKRCCGCHETVAAEGYYKNKSAKDGLYSYCKRCFCKRYTHRKAS